MNHYDDLQRFKDKTRNQQYEFKDLSAQNTAQDQGNWALINQLSPASEENKLAMGGHVSLPQPQPVNPTLFANNENTPAAANPAPEVTLAAEVIPTSAAPILRDIAQQLAATSAPVAQTVVTTAPSPAVAPVAPPAPKPTYSAPAQPVPTTVEPASYARLFAPKPAEAKPATEKNQSLHTLLERIASCR